MQSAQVSSAANLLERLIQNRGGGEDLAAGLCEGAGEVRVCVSPVWG